ncbi:MAG: rod shape-determining protein MreD, partial [Acidimicrobiales bacterium]|nr:rod shape-determining protein MreD [Acidimicrobiales bacterium]
TSYMREDPRFRLPIMFIAALVIQTTLLARLRIFGVMPDFMLLLAAAGGITAGATRGATLGFASGMLIDLFLPTPLGLSALVFTLVGYGVGVANTGVLRSAWYIPVLTAGGASVAGVTLYALIGSMLGERMVNGHLVTIAVVVGLSNAVLAPVAVKFVDWSLGSLKSGPRIPV